MVKQQKMQSFFKRKGDEGIVKSPLAPDALALVPYMDGRHAEDAQEGQMEDDNVQENQMQDDDVPDVEQRANEHVTFRGIELLERDPALRPQIWQYPPNQRDEVRRAYLRLGPNQPKREKYKAIGKPGHRRRFQYNYFRDFPSWLEYSLTSHSAYCLYCFLFSKNRKKRGGFDVFTTQGFNNWKKVHDGQKCALLVHMGSSPCSQHNNAVRDGHALLDQSNHLANIFEVKTMGDKEKDRLRLRTTIAVVKWLTFQSCALRGHDERPESRNRGNFLEMLKLLADFCPDVQAVVLENAPQVCKYTSHEIQNEILSIYAMKVREHIRAEIGDSKYSVLVDETCDVSKREQMALVFRFVDKDGYSQERFFHLIHVANTKALTLKMELCKVLSKHGFDVQNLRGQGCMTPRWLRLHACLLSIRLKQAKEPIKYAH
ncbi:hypothetical protein VPH35_032002 [Triticum aestivum]